MNPRILLVEDETAIRDMISFALQRTDMDIIPVESVREARNNILEQVPDLILLDWMLPGISGIEYARQLKKEELTADTPIIMLTARSEEDDRVHGLQTGVDDYITKPFSTRELIERIKAVLRRTKPHLEKETISQGLLTIDLASHRVLAGDDTIKLGPTEFNLLAFFMTHPERVYSRTQLLDHVWGGNVYVEERTVDVHIRRLRKNLAPFNCDAYIQTVRGAGYRFSCKLSA